MSTRSRDPVEELGRVHGFDTRRQESVLARPRSRPAESDNRDEQLLVFALVAGSRTMSRVRRRTLTVFDDALVVQRDQYRLIVPWQDITAVQRLRHQKIMDVEELVFSGGRVEAVDSRGRSSSLPRGLAEHPALTRVMVSLYAKNWRQGPIGEKVRVSVSRVEFANNRTSGLMNVRICTPRGYQSCDVLTWNTPTGPTGGVLRSGQ